MKKHLFTVVLALVLTVLLFTVTIAAVDTQAVKMEAVAGTGVDLTSLEEGDTFDIYITVPLTLGNTNQYYYRGYDLGSASKTFNASNAKLSDETITLGWTSADMYVSKVEYVSDPPSGKTYATATSLNEAGTLNDTTVYYAFPATTPGASIGAPSVTGSGDTAATALTISYGGAFNGYMININKVSPKPAAPTLGVIAKVTFTVAKESGAAQTITLTNSHKISGESESYSAPTVGVTIKAGCLHPEGDRNYNHADALAKNKAATCYSTGEQWFYCNNCSKLAKEDVAMLPHNFTNYVVESPATCWAAGSAKWYCVNDGCTEYDHTQGNDGVITLAKLTHEVGEFIDTATCTEDGYAFYTCTKCSGLSADGNSYINISYVSDTDSFINNNTGAPYSAPATFISYAKGHDYVQDAENPAKYVCSRCGGELIVDASSRVRYVSQYGGGDGKSEANPTTLRAAFDELGVLPEVVDATIYLVGDKIAFDEVSAVSPACSNCFEESKHANHITITSANLNHKTILEFNSDVKFYFLYGPTTFENVQFASTVVGKAKSAGDSVDSGGASIIARGFKLVMGEGLNMLSSEGTMHAQAAVCDNVSVYIPDVKMYIAGGFYFLNASTPMIYPGADPQSVQTDVTILSGEYWCIEGLNRGTGATTYSGAHATITFAGGTFASMVPITSTSNAVFSGENNVIDIHYVAGNTYSCVWDYRSGINAMTGKITVNRFFHNGAQPRVGDFKMGSASVANNTRIVNYYWDTEMASDKRVTKFRAKGDQYAASYAETNHSGPFVAYCIDMFGEHDYVDGICTRCGLSPCDTHVYSVVSETPATCSSSGLKISRCDRCFIYLEETQPAQEGVHAYHFVFTKPDLYTCECADCHTKVCTVNPQTALATSNNVIYVSDKGVAWGGFSPELPLNDYEMAFKIAAASGEDEMTICVVGTITLKGNTSFKGGSAFLEPAHIGTHITVCGYDKTPNDDDYSLGTIFCDGYFYDGASRRSVYGLNGDTTFDQIEFSSNENYGNINLAARHNALVLGEHMTADFMRSSLGGEAHVGNVIVIGGCYSGVFGDYCAGSETYVEIHSGTYRAIYGGSVNQACAMNTEDSSVQLELLGNIFARELIVFGSRNSSSTGLLENIHVTVNGTVQSGAHIVFGSYDNKPKAGQVTIDYCGGYFAAYAGGSNLESTAATLSVYAGRMLGSSRDDNDFSLQLDSIDIIYNSSDKQVVSFIKSLKAQIKSLADAKKPLISYLDISMDCINGQEHLPDAMLDSKDATCSEAGYATYHCEICGKNYTEIIEKLDHEFGAWEKVTDKNCMSPEVQKCTCAVCGYAKYKTVGKADANAHDLVDGICTRCGYDKTVGCEHDWNDPIIESSGCGSCTVYICKLCGCKRTEDITGTHNYGKYTVTVEPTATTPGLKTRTCKDCGKVDTAILYATDGALTSEGIAVDENGKTTDIDTKKLSKSQKAVVNAFLSTTEIGTEVKYAYKVNANGTATFSIPLPEKYADLKNVKVMVKGDDGKITEVQFTVDRGYIVFTY